MLRQLRRVPGVSKVSGENAGLHLLVYLDQGLGEEEAIRRAAEEEVRIYGLSQYDIGEEQSDKGRVILGYGSLTEEEICKACERLRKAWSR